MKVFIFIFLLTLSSASFGSLDICLKDAETNGNHNHAINPPLSCADLIKAHPEKVSVSSSDGSMLVYGLGHMFFVEKDSVKELMAGDQTELEDIRKFEINLLKNKILVLQEDSVLTFRSDFVGNVTPERVYKESFLESAHRVKLLDKENIIAIFANEKVQLIDANSDSRYPQVEALKAKVLFQISGPHTGLEHPTDAVYSKINGEIYILDTDRILIFPTSSSSPSIPTKIIPVKESHSLTLNNDRLILIKSTGEQVEVLLIN